VVPAKFHRLVDERGVTQVRLRFKRGDNDDGGNDSLKLLSGDVGKARRPQLVVKYYVP
jgi:hypothetical protein